MRLLLVLLVVASLSVISFGSSYGQTLQPITAIAAQIVVQDANGNLVAYLEITKINVNDLPTLSHGIDQRPDIFHQSSIVLYGQNYDLFEAKNVVVSSSANVISKNSISLMVGNKPEVLAVANHDGFPVVPGDKVTTYWKILRLAS
ncbi:MAG: hypothetical protein ACREA3_04630 [Nitrosotalea sp.]